MAFLAVGATYQALCVKTLDFSIEAISWGQNMETESPVQD